MLAAPANLTATVNSATSVTLTWTPNADATSYTITRQVGTGAFATLTTITQRVGRYHSPIPRLLGTTYSYKIADTNALGPFRMPARAWVSVLTLPATPTLTAVG